MMENRKYEFDWSLLGDIPTGRPNLGNSTRLEIYRLMQFTFRDIIEKRYGTQAADEVFYAAGEMAGKAFFRHVINQAEDFDAFVRALQDVMVEMGMGILRIEKADLERGELLLTISEDLDCSGLPEMDTEICVYDEGFLAGLIESFSGRKYHVKEIDCWCSGDRTCRFEAKAVK